MSAMPEATMVKRLRLLRRGEEIIAKAAEPIAIAPAKPKKMIVEQAMMKRWEATASIGISCGHVHICAFVRILSRHGNTGCLESLTANTIHERGIFTKNQS